LFKWHAKGSKPAGICVSTKQSKTVGLIKSAPHGIKVYVISSMFYFLNSKILTVYFCRNDSRKIVAPKLYVVPIPNLKHLVWL